MLGVIFNDERQIHKRLKVYAIYIFINLIIIDIDIDIGNDIG
jgi:hypothetical protein